MWLNETLKIKYPLIQGGMANIATGAFAAAVSNAGGLGLIAGGGMSPDMLRENIREAKKLTDKPFGVNLMLLHPQADEMADIVVEEKVPVVTTGAGNPGIYINKWKEAGIIVMPVVPSVALAKRMERAGVDAVIAEGTESGGHVGELTTMALVPQVKAAVNIPVIVAGGSVNQEAVKYLQYPNVYVITGMNLPIVLSVCLSLSSCDKVNEDIIRNAIDDAKSQIVYVNDVMKNMEDDEDDE